MKSYVERTEKKVDCIGIRLPHYDERDDEQGSRKLEDEPRENGSHQRVEDVEYERAEKRANIFNRRYECE